jgi:hypothetical protein
MKRLLGIGAIVLGVIGAIVCPAAIGLGWVGAVRTTDRATVVAKRLDSGLLEADARLARVEKRATVLRTDLAETRVEAEKLDTENAELPQVRAAIERLRDRLLPTVGRAADLADSLRAVAVGLRAVEDVIKDFGVEVQQPSRARAAADAIDRAAEMLDVPQTQINAVKSAAALRLKRELLGLAVVAAAGSERLAEGLADTRREVSDARQQVEACRARVVSWVRLTTLAHTVVWAWIGLGQLCLIGWGRRKSAKRVAD